MNGKPQKTLIAKVSRPRISYALTRERLYTLLDAGRSNPLIWIAGPGGSGKSTLVSGWLEERGLPCLWYQADEADADPATFIYYLGLAAQRANPRKKRRLPLLTPEYSAGMPAFARRFYDELFNRLPPPYVLVFDNFQDIPSTSPVHDLLLKGVEVMPAGIAMIMISRSEPPAPYARLRAAKQVAFIGWNELRFVPEEIAALSRTIPWKFCGEESCPAAGALYERTDGWAAGLVLLLESLRRVSSRKDATRMADSSHCTEHLPDLNCQGVFDYFASELFCKTEESDCDFLLKSAFLPFMTAKMARRLTASDNAGRILLRLSQNHCFTDWRSGPEPVYQYHPLFREFLLKTAAERLDVAEIAEVRRRAAALLDEAGMTGEAVELYLDTGAWDEAAELVTGEAEKLIMQGRSAVLESWLLRFPESMFDERPWTLYWLGVAKLGRCPAEGRGLLERALRLFASKDDETGMLLAWAAATESIYYGFDDYREFDAWIAWLDARKPLELSYPSPRVELSVCISMVMALTARQPYHPDLDAWLKRLLALFQQHREEFACFRAATIFAFYLYYWRGDFFMMGVQAAEIQNMAKSGAVPPLFQVVCEYLSAEMELDCKGDPAACLLHVRSALRIAEETGAMVMNGMLLGLGAYSAILTGDLVLGEEFLARLQSMLTPERKHNYCHYYYLAAFVAAMRAEHDRARDFMRLALQFAEETGFFYPLIMCLTRMAVLLHRDGEAVEADRLLERALELSTNANSAIFRYACLLEKSRIAFDRGRESDGATLLAEALHIGAQGNYFGPLWWREQAAMARLCAKALAYGIEPEYARILIRVNRLEPGEDSPDNWPYPLRIRTFGGFEIVKDGKPLLFSGKMPKKPLELLKALIAFGGAGVSQEEICDALWPDADGDTAGSSLKFTLHQLRKLLGSDACILVKGGSLSLSSRCCYTDASALQNILRRIRRMTEHPDAASGEEIALLAEKAVRTYQGDFLRYDQNYSWVSVARERYKWGILRLLNLACDYYEETGQWKKAVRLCERSLDADDLNEDTYRRLMFCLCKLGRHSAALAAYSRCRSMLAARLGVLPTPETESLYRSMLVHSGT